MFLLSLYCIRAIGNVAFCNRISENTLLLLRIIQAKGSADIKSLERIQV